MTERRCLAAFTACIEQPPYTNISQHADGTVEVTVRGPAALGPEQADGKRYMDCGPSTSHRMSAEDFAVILRDVVKNFRT